MNRIVADPSIEPSFNHEVSRLSLNVHEQLAMLRASPNSASLATFQSRLGNHLAASINKISLSAYNNAAKAIGEVARPVDLKSLSGMALTRGNVASTLMADASKKPLDITAGLSKSGSTSKLRATRASGYELRLAYFIGTTRAWELKKKSKKLWLLSNTHDDDDICDENAEEGPISVYDFFTSGDMYCPAHLNCECTMALIL